MADEKNKVEETQEPATEQVEVERVGEAEKAEAEAIEALPKEGKVVVSGVNVATRHRKPTQLNPQGGLERKEAPMHVSKVAIVDPKDGKATRVRFEMVGDKKVRVAARSGEKNDG